MMETAHRALLLAPGTDPPDGLEELAWKTRTRAHSSTDRLAPRRRFEKWSAPSPTCWLPHPPGAAGCEALLQGIAGGIRLRARRVGWGRGRPRPERHGRRRWPVTAPLALDLSRRDRGPARRAGAVAARRPPLRWTGVRPTARAAFRSRSVDGLVLAKRGARPPRGRRRPQHRSDPPGPRAFPRARAGAPRCSPSSGRLDPGPVHCSRLRQESTSMVDRLPLAPRGRGPAGWRWRRFPCMRSLAPTSPSAARATPISGAAPRRFLRSVRRPEAKCAGASPSLPRARPRAAPLGSPRWPDATGPAGFAQLFRALILRGPERAFPHSALACPHAAPLGGMATRNCAAPAVFSLLPEGVR